jgi:TonB family protein
MNQIFRSALLTVCLLVGSLMVVAQADVDLKQSAEAKPESWQQFVSPEGRFTMLFPGSPSVSEEVVDRLGVRFVVHKTQLRTFAEYGVIYSDYPKSVTDTTAADVLLDEGAKGGVAEINAQLLSINPIWLSGYPGRLLKERLPNGQIMQAKMILAGQRMYQIAITTPREDGADPATVGFYNSIATKFLDSFQLTYAKKDTVLASGTCPPDIQNCVPVTDDVLNGRAISLPLPAYPTIARAAHATGTVGVRVLIDEEGVVISAASVSGHPLLQAAAVAAARQARFTPTLVDNKPVKVLGIIQYNFAMGQ